MGKKDKFKTHRRGQDSSASSVFDFQRSRVPSKLGRDQTGGGRATVCDNGDDSGRDSGDDDNDYDGNSGLDSGVASLSDCMSKATINASPDTHLEGEVSDGEGADEDGDGDDVSRAAKLGPRVANKIFMWEFGQNDPKRDSGSKLKRLGYARLLKLKQPFNGVVLSSETQYVINPQDAALVEQYGIAGINCSWNRLDEIPFSNLGKARNQRKLPFLYAANSVNYGRPYKMNTAEAIAACLYITGFKEDAHKLLSPFGYGEEFIRLNKELLDAYSSCSNMEEVIAAMNQYLAALEEAKRAKAARLIQEETKNNSSSSKISTSYLSRDDLPPSDSDDDYEYEYEDEEAQGEEGAQGEVSNEEA